MVETTENIIQSLQKSPEGLDGVLKLNILQIQQVLKCLFESQKKKDEDILSLKKQVLDLNFLKSKYETKRVLNNATKTAGGEEVHSITTEHSKAPSAFDTLFTKNVPHILEKIFLSLDYKSFKTCQRACNSWNVLLTSASMIKKARSVFQEDIFSDQLILWRSARSGRTDEVRRLLSTRMMNLKRKFMLENTRPTTPLCEAANRGYKEVVQLLLEGGAAPDEGEDQHWTPLCMASYNGHKDVVKLLLDGGANIKKVNKIRWTPLHYAAAFNDIDVAQLLLKHGADQESRFALHFAGGRVTQRWLNFFLIMGLTPTRLINMVRLHCPLLYEIT